MNKVILTGNLVKEIEPRRTSNGTSVVSNCIAVSRDRKNPDGTYGTDFINFVAWDKQADFLIAYAKKGDRLEIVGRWETRQYEDKNGQKITANEVIVENLNCYAKKTDKPAEQSEQIAEQVKEEPELHQGSIVDNYDNDTDLIDDDLPF